MADNEYDLYERLGSVIFDAPLEEVSKDQRTKAKELVWSWAYSIRTPSSKLGEAYDKVVAEMKEMRGDKE
jgi:hypothetical protein